MATYVNRLGQTVTTSATATGMLPATDIAVPNTADAQPTAKQADGTDVADSVGLATPFAPQYSGSSGSAGGFPATHAT